MTGKVPKIIQQYFYRAFNRNFDFRHYYLVKKSYYVIPVVK